MSNGEVNMYCFIENNVANKDRLYTELVDVLPEKH